MSKDWKQLLHQKQGYLGDIVKGRPSRNDIREGDMKLYYFDKKLWIVSKYQGELRYNPFVEGEGPWWDDLRAPASRIRQGATQKPDYDFTENGLLFPQNDATEIAYIILQMPHAWREGTEIFPHVHYVQDSATTPSFFMDYRVYDVGQSVPAGWTTYEFDIHEAIGYSSGSIHQIAWSRTPIKMGGLKLSCMMDVQLYRDDNDYVGDALVKEFDLHYQVDQFGSEEQYKKKARL